MLHPFPTMLDAHLDAAMRDVLSMPHRGLELPALRETEDGSYTLTLSAPGIKAQDLQITVDEGVLKVEGHSKATGLALRQAVRLPRAADGDKATATSVDGILTIAVPKKPEAAPLTIAVAQSPDEETTPGEDEAAPEPYRLTIAAPGLAASDVTVEALVLDGVLTAAGETKKTGARLDKHLRLPRDADLAGTKAVHVDGLLTLTVPKKTLVVTKKTLVVNEAPPAPAAEDVAMV